MESGMGAVGIIVLLLGIVAAAALVFLVVAAIVQVVRKPRLPLLLKIVWVYVLIQFPLIGALVWFMFGDEINGRLATGLR